MAKTGKKLTTVVAKAVIIAEATSVVASYITCINFLPFTPSFSGISRCLIIFSVNTIPTSTITPMAIAIPERATILASTSKNFINIKVIKTPIGSKLEINIEALRFNTKTRTTSMLINIS